MKPFHFLSFLALTATLVTAPTLRADLFTDQIASQLNEQAYSLMNEVNNKKSTDVSMNFGVRDPRDMQFLLAVTALTNQSSMTSLLVRESTQFASNKRHDLRTATQILSMEMNRLNQTKTQSPGFQFVNTAGLAFAIQNAQNYFGGNPPPPPPPPKPALGSVTLKTGVDDHILIKISGNQAEIIKEMSDSHPQNGIYQTFFTSSYPIGMNLDVKIESVSHVDCKVSVYQTDVGGTTISLQHPKNGFGWCDLKVVWYKK